MEFLDYVKPELLVLIPVLYLIALALRKCGVAERWLPLVLGSVGVFLSLLWVVATCQVECAKHIAMAFFTALTQGILATGASLLAERTLKKKK